MNRLVSLTSVWNSALWVNDFLTWAYPLVDRLVIQEANWCSDDSRWAGDTSPDGTADIIRSFPDPKQKIEFYQLGRFNGGCLAARAELCSHIPECDWVWVCDVDEFHSNAWHQWLDQNLKMLKRQGVTTISQSCRAFYFDFTRHTNEGFTRLFRWHPGLNCWGAHYFQSKDFNASTVLDDNILDSASMGHEIFHYSYVPPPGVEIKGAQSFDVSLERYQSWYRDVYSRFDGTNLQELYDKNGGGVHVFGGLPLADYYGPHPEVLDDHPLRYAVWRDGQYFEDGTRNEIELNGWWNQKERRQQILRELTAQAQELGIGY